MVAHLLTGGKCPNHTSAHRVTVRLVLLWDSSELMIRPNGQSPDFLESLPFSAMILRKSFISASE